MPPRKLSDADLCDIPPVFKRGKSAVIPAAPTVVPTQQTLESLAGRITDTWNRADQSATAAVEGWLEAGRLLNEAKAQVGHGGWKGFVETLDRAPKEAERLMKIAKDGRLTKSTNLSILPLFL